MWEMALLLGTGATVLGGAVANMLKIQAKNPHMTRPDKMRQKDNLIHLLSLLTWPVLYFAICASTGLTLSSDPYILLGLLWPVFLIGARMVSIQWEHKEPLQESHVRHGEARGSAGLLFTAAFGVGVLLTALRKDADVLGSKLVLMALLLCVAFLIPAATQPISSGAAHMIRTTQTCISQMAIGIFILGITVSYFRIPVAKLKPTGASVAPGAAPRP